MNIRSITGKEQILIRKGSGELQGIRFDIETSRDELTDLRFGISGIFRDSTNCFTSEMLIPPNDPLNQALETFWWKVKNILWCSFRLNENGSASRPVHLELNHDCYIIVVRDWREADAKDFLNRVS